MREDGSEGRRKLCLVLALLLSSNVLLFYSLPAMIFITIILILAITYYFIGGVNALLVTFSLIVNTFIIEVVLQLTSLGESVYYRPHERFAIRDRDLGHGRYKENVNYKGVMRHGDLRALAVTRNVESEPREIVFKTDSFGFRNNYDYSGQIYFLIGDSFIVGNGTTQRETLAEQLQSRYGIDAYNFGHPGSVTDYVKYIRTIRTRISDEPRVILFLFEGNDFPSSNAPRTKTLSTHSHWLSLIPGWWRLNIVKTKYLAFFQATYTYKVMLSLISRISTIEERVDVFSVRGIPVAFFRPYIAVSKRKEFQADVSVENLFEEMREVLTHIFFIPTKYRVYCKHIELCSKDGSRGLPNSQWLYLRELGRRLGIATTNLTPALIKESDRLLEEGDDMLTFWRDDTHWNKYGIAIAAAEVAKVLEEDDDQM